MNDEDADSSSSPRRRKDQQRQSDIISSRAISRTTSDYSTNISACLLATLYSFKIVYSQDYRRVRTNNKLQVSVFCNQGGRGQGVCLFHVTMFVVTLTFPVGIRKQQSDKMNVSRRLRLASSPFKNKIRQESCAVLEYKSGSHVLLINIRLWFTLKCVKSSNCLFLHPCH